VEHAFCILALGHNLTHTVVTRRSHTLVTGGLYRFVRHPLYDSAAVLAVATSMTMANRFVLLTGALVFLLLAVRPRTEEDKLLARLGDAYRASRSRTGHFVPKITGGVTSR
jgi:protein-S-isoprenylcysteine O-methyltransferase Ste14